MINLYRKEDLLSRPKIGEALLLSKDKKSNLKFIVFGLSHPDSPYEDDHEWIDVLLEYSSCSHNYQCGRFKFRRYGLFEAASNLESFRPYTGLGAQILADDRGLQTIRCEIAAGRLVIKAKLGDFSCEATLSFETTIAEVRGFQKQLKNLSKEFPTPDFQPSLDFVEALQDYQYYNAELTESHKWVLQTITDQIRRIERPLLLVVRRHLRRYESKGRPLSEFEAYRLKAFVHKLAVSEALGADQNLIRHFEKMGKRLGNQTKN